MRALFFLHVHLVEAYVMHLIWSFNGKARRTNGRNENHIFTYIRNLKSYFDFEHIVSGANSYS